VGSFLIVCAVLLSAVGCSGTRSEAPQKEQTHSLQETVSEEARCEGTRTFHLYFVVYPNLQNSPLRSGSEEAVKKADKKARQKVDDLGLYTTNDLPGCPKGGLLKGTDKPDGLSGKHGDDEVRGLSGTDDLEGGPGSDTLYGGGGDDYLETLTPFLEGPYGEDVLYGGDGSDQLYARDGQQDEIYCGEGKDVYDADKNDYVDSSCEKKARFGGGA
jgi:hypothetical protein